MDEIYFHGLFSFNPTPQMVYPKRKFECVLCDPFGALILNQKRTANINLENPVKREFLS